MSLQFQSLTAQVAQAFHRQIRDGTWAANLPGERQLAKHFQVSRKTIRRALAELRSAGVLSTADRGSVLRRKPKTPRPSTSHIALLLPQPLEASRPFTAVWINELMNVLQASGYALQVVHGAHFYAEHAAGLLTRLTSAKPARCWIIGGSNRAIQEWFAASGIPTIVAGSTHTGVALPSVDIDHRAVCRHCATMFVRQGHKRLAMFLDRGGYAGVAESEQGFREGLTAVSAEEPVICSSERNAALVIREIKRLLARPEPPTGWLVSNSHSYLTVLSYLASLGLRVPRDISLVSRDDDTFLRFMHPTPTFYSARPVRFAQALHRGLKRMLGGDTSPFAIRVMSDFSPGNSVAAPSARGSSRT